MDARRFNDLLKLVGAFAASLVTLVPFLSGKPAVLVAAAAATLGAFVAGFGTRSVGTEYQAVADAKAIAKASMIPPPMAAVIMTPIPSRPPPPPPTEAM